MSVKAEALTGGFSDAVFDSQRIFKKLMDGMARPGTPQTIETAAARRYRLALQPARFCWRFATMIRRSG